MTNDPVIADFLSFYNRIFFISRKEKFYETTNSTVQYGTVTFDHCTLKSGNFWPLYLIEGPSLYLITSNPVNRSLIIIFRPELKLGESVCQSAARIQMITNHWWVIKWANPVKPFLAPQIFMTHFSPRWFVFSLYSLYVNYMIIIHEK